MLRKRSRLKSAIGHYKFCPSCGTRLESSDTYCTRCGYSFADRGNRRSVLKWKNIIFIVIIIALFYFSIRYFNGQSILPTSILDAFNFTITKKTP